MGIFDFENSLYHCLKMSFSIFFSSLIFTWSIREALTSGLSFWITRMIYQYLPIIDHGAFVRWTLLLFLNIGNSKMTYVDGTLLEMKITNVFIPVYHVIINLFIIYFVQQIVRRFMLVFLTDRFIPLNQEEIEI